tara:strand:+ start:27 stop:605 length:579 start_codon:yes stop_codon:yes gene_type:complete
MTDLTNNSKVYRGTIMLCVLAVGMFGFAYALVPLYDVFCELTGINGKTSGQSVELLETESDSGRVVTVQFLARVGNGMPWEFRPATHQYKVKLGQTSITNYYARNRATYAVTGQAVPSISPGHTAEYVKKVECFCFNQQELEAGEETNMPVKFYISEELPDDVNTVTLSYTMFKAPARKPPTHTAMLSSNRI